MKYISPLTVHGINGTQTNTIIRFSRLLYLVLVLLSSTLCPSRFAIIIVRERELVALLCLPDALWQLVFYGSSSCAVE